LAHLDYREDATVLLYSVTYNISELYNYTELELDNKQHDI